MIDGPARATMLPATMKTRFTAAAVLLAALSSRDALADGLDVQMDPADIAIGLVSSGAKSGLAFRAKFSGDFQGDVDVELVREGGETRRGGGLRFARAQTFGSLAVYAETNQTYGEPDVEGQLVPGDYKLLFRFSAMRAGKTMTTTVERAFRVATGPTTGGDKAVLVVAPVPPFVDVRWGAFMPGTDDVSGGTSTELRGQNFWLALTTAPERVKSDVSLVLFQGGNVVGRAHKTLSVGALRDDLPLVNPVVGWMAPEKDLPAGAWQLAVVQDGVYLTTCAFNTSARGDVTPRHVPCAPAPALAAKAIAAAPETGKVDVMRGKEARALSRSDKARALKKRILEETRSADTLAASGRSEKESSLRSSLPASRKAHAAASEGFYARERAARTRVTSLKKEYDAIVHMEGA